MATSSQATQKFVPFKEIRDGVVVMKDGSMRIILMVSSLNFALKSEEEQIAILASFQNFLNSLDFSIQFFIQSREYDIRPYIALLEERERAQVHELLRIQTHEYINFIKSFTESANIMSKNFFVVIPYTPSIIQKNSGSSNPLSSLFGGGKKTKTQKLEDFETNLSQLQQRAYIAQQGLTRTGVRSKQLGTQEIIELFYRMFNPGEDAESIRVN